jgi:hypothetical protein
MLLGATTLYSQNQTDAIFQGYYWNTFPGDITDINNGGTWWDTLANAAPELAGAGFKTVWVPPPSKGFAGSQDMGFGIQDYYDLGEYLQSGTVRTRHGNRAQLDNMINALHSNGLLVMADLVLNHRAGAGAQQLEDCDDGNGLQLRFTDFDVASNRSPMNNWDFHPNFIHCDLNAPYHDRSFFEDLCYFNFLNPVLDPLAPNNGWYHGPHNLGRVGDSLIVWGRYLLDDVGFDELRLDAVKHIEPGFLAPFLVEMAAGDQPFAVGELFDGNLGTLKSYHDQVETFVSTFGVGSKDANLAIFDFNLRYALRDMANDGSGGYNMANLSSSGLKFNPAGGLDGDDIVTFVENHDVDRIGWQTVPCPGGDVQIGGTCLQLFTDGGHDPVFSDKHMAYAYIMAAEGRPSVFYKDWYQYGLAEEIKWMMGLRSAMATGGSVPLISLNAYFTAGAADDMFVMTRAGSGGAQDGLVFTLNDNPSIENSGFFDTPYANLEMKDYSDAFMFTQTQVFADGRSFLRAGPRNYAWYGPTGLYPQTPDQVPSEFTLGNHQGAKLHFVNLLVAEASNYLVNGAPIQPGDQVAITPVGSTTAVGLGRVGQSFAWDGVHDMVIEVLGGNDPGNSKGGLENGDSFDLWVYDKSTGQTIKAGNLSFDATGSVRNFSPDRPDSRGGSAPFGLSITAGNAYSVGGISVLNALNACKVEFTYTQTDETCDLAEDGSATITAVGGSGSYQYSLDNGSTWTTATANPFTITLGDGDYDVKVRDANYIICVSEAQTISILPGALPSFTYLVTNPGCQGNATGSIEISVTPGPGPYAFSLDGGQNYIPGNSPFSFGNLPLGDYDLRVKTGDGCESEISTASVVSNTSLPDFDNDGIADDCDPDDDNDGQSDDDEIACGSDPFDEQSLAPDVDGDDIPDCVDPVNNLLASVVARVWDDQNGNGIQDNSEPGISGATVKLLNVLNQKLKQTTTDSKGEAAFHNLADGLTVKLEFVKPAKHARANKDQGSNDNKDSDANLSNGRTATFQTVAGQFITRWDAGFYSPGTVEAFVWDDRNGNGIQDNNEPGISGATVKLLNSINQKLKQVNTNANGIATLTGVPADIDVKLEFVKPAKHARAEKDQGSNDNKDSDANLNNGRTATFQASKGNQTHTKWDAGFYSPGTVEAFVWDDRNGNGIQDNNEPGISGATVKLLNASNQKLKQANTNANGIATLTGVPADIDVKLEFVKPSKHGQADKDQGSNDNKDSDANLNNGRTATFQASKGNQTHTKWDAGFYSPGTVEAFVWDDRNGNGIQDNNEPGISGATVKLLNASNQKLKQANTNASGIATLTGVPADIDVKLEFAKPAKHARAGKDKGSNDNKDSDANLNNGRTATFQASKGYQTHSKWDAGFYSPGTVEAFVWDDQNGNGIQDNNEPGISGATVKLLNASNQKLKQANTNANGIATLTGVPADIDVKLEFVKPAKHGRAGQDQGSNDNKDSDANLNNGRTATFQASKGYQTHTKWDAGFYSPGTAEAYVWDDQNGNGIQDNNEPGITGVTVKLLDSNNQKLKQANTNASGIATLSGVPADIPVKLEFVASSSYAFTLKDQGSNDNKDSDASLSNGRTATFQASKGYQTHNKWDAGLTPAPAAAVSAGGNGSLQLNLYPVPVQEQLTLEVVVSETQEATYRITDLMGRELQRKTLVLQAGKNLIEIPVDQLPSATYNLTLQTGQEARNRTFVVVR